MTLRTRKSSADEAYRVIALRAYQLRALTVTRHGAWGASGASFEAIRLYLTDLLAVYKDLNDAKSVPGVGQAAKDAEGDQAYDVVAEVTVLQGLMVAVKDRVLLDVPKDSNGWTLGHKFNMDGSDDWRVFSAGALSTLLGNMQAIVDQVDS